VEGLVQVTPGPGHTLRFRNPSTAATFKKHTIVFEHASEDAADRATLVMPVMSSGEFRERLSSKGSTLKIPRSARWLGRILS